jgi:hypothetical protein
MLIRFFFSVIILCFLQITCYSQESGGPPKKEQSLKSKRKLRKADKKKWKEERSAQRAEEKNRDAHHKRVQTKAVYKRMKQSRAKSNSIRENKRDPFYKRWFQNNQKRKRVHITKERTN